MGASQEEGAAPNREVAVAPCPDPANPFPRYPINPLQSQHAHDVSSASRQRVPRVTDSSDGCHIKCWDSPERVPGGALVTEPGADLCLLQREGRESSRECRTSPYYFSS